MIKPMTGSKLLTWRMKENLTREEASARFGVNAATWWRWEQGKIGHPFILAMACAFFENQKQKM